MTHEVVSRRISSRRHAEGEALPCFGHMVTVAEKGDAQRGMSTATEAGKAGRHGGVGVRAAHRWTRK